MGFFSWNTSDTCETIWNCFTEKVRTVYLYCPDGTVIREPEYEGYGVFDGKDAYALLARWNAPAECTGEDEHDRIIGIDLDEEEIQYPLKFSFRNGLKYYDLPAATMAKNQGYFVK